MEKIRLISLILNPQSLFRPRNPLPLAPLPLPPSKSPTTQRNRKGQIWFCLSSAYYQELNPG